MSSIRLIPTILCGGSGSRLWPVSRDLHPKPFIRLADGQSLLQKSFLRGAALPGVSEVLTVTNRELSFKAKDEFAEINTAGLATSFILEPFGRNTAAAIATTVLWAEKTRGADTLILVLAADHLVADQAAFAAAVAKACELAQQNRLVTFGIQPDAPETGYGYIEASGHDVLRFVEKPNKETAEEYLSTGRFLWNSGMFCFKTSTMLEAMQAHCPEILESSRQCLKGSRHTQGNNFSEIDLDATSFKQVPSTSIDYAVMELSKQVAVVPCDIGWSDIGSWNALGDLSPADDNGNRVVGDTVLLHEANNCYVQSDRVVGAVGVDDLIVVDTPDALLVAHRDNVQDVKQIYATLKSQGHDAHKVHVTVRRPWGNYTVLEETPSFKIKRIVVKPGASLSLQMHHHRSEHWVVVTGIARVVNGDKEFFVNPNESTFIPAGCQHRLENPGLLELVMIEVQHGEYLGEDDIVRFQDTYGRTTPAR